MSGASLPKACCALLLALFALLAAGMPGTALAQAPGAVPNIAAKLEVEGPVQPGAETRIAIRFTPVSDEWHGYWSNPGDAGLGMQVEWDLPEGVSISEFVYPTPDRLMIGELMNHIFKGEYAVLATLRVAEGVTVPEPFVIEGEAFYLVCTDEICVPEEASLRAVVEVGEPRTSSRFAEYQSAIAPPLDEAALFKQAGGNLRIAIPLPATLEVGAPHLFIANRDLVNYADTQVFRRDGDMLVGEIPLAGTGDQPGRVSGILRLGDGTGLRFEATLGEVPVGGTVLAGATEIPAWWVLIGGALLGGLILNIMPCVFPILSLKALSLARAGGSEREAQADALAYTAGVVLACLALGGLLLALRAAGESVGWAFQLQEPSVVVVLFLLAVALTANFLGTFEIPGLALREEGAGSRSSFVTGLLAAFVATPCTGPFMAAALGAALVVPPIPALAIFASLGLGLALPFLLLGFVPAMRRALPKPGPWMETFRRWMALPMGLTALALAWLVWRLGGWTWIIIIAGLALIVIGALVRMGRAQRQSGSTLLPGVALAATVALAFLLLPEPERPSASSGSQVVASEPFSAEALAQARAEGRPVFLYFTADWCVTCKVNEGVAIERQATADALEAADVLVLRGDWTLRDPEITAFLTEQGVAGVPLYLWYEPRARAPERLPQVLTPRSVEQRASALVQPPA